MDKRDLELHIQDQELLIKELRVKLDKTSINYADRGEYMAGFEYKVLDLVKYDGSYYLCAHSTNETPDTSSKWYSLEKILIPQRGEKGDRGEMGDRGEKGEKGDIGIQGIRGERGLQGEAGKAGVAGLQGKQGVKGDKGDKGDTGDSAYDIWLKAGNKGSKDVFLKSLQGKTLVQSQRVSGGIISTVNHGTNANYKRPENIYPVTWVGSVEPLNATDNDIWIDTA